MATKKIPQLAARSVALTGDEELEIAYNDNSYRLTTEQLFKTVGVLPGLSGSGNPVPASGFRIPLYKVSDGQPYSCTLDQAVSSAIGTVPAGGTTGQLLTKSSDGDYDLEWSSSTLAAGTDQQIQFNDGGATAGASALAWDKTNGKLVHTKTGTGGTYDTLAGYATGTGNNVPFNTNVSYHNFTDGSGVGGENYTNEVYSRGWNVSDPGVPVVSGKFALWEAMEYKFNNGGVYGGEWHREFADTSGNRWRWETAFLPHNGNEGAMAITWQLGRMMFARKDGTVKVSWRLADGVCDVNGGFKFAFDVNNVAVMTQMNAAGNAALTLPYIDSDNRLRISQPIYAQGTWPSSNEFYQIQALGTGVNGSTILSMSGSVSAGYLFGVNLSGSAPYWLASTTYNSHATGSAVQWLYVLSSGTGDAFSYYDVNGGSGWAVGVDNSDSDMFKVALSADFDFSAIIRATTGLNVAAGKQSMATTATDGFFFVPACAGTPTGVPTGISTFAPLIVDTTNHKLYFYSGGAWRDAGP